MAACGAPERTPLHAQNVANLALAMVENIRQIKTVDNNEVEIRIGNYQTIYSNYFIIVQIPNVIDSLIKNDFALQESIRDLQWLVLLV